VASAVRLLRAGTVLLAAVAGASCSLFVPWGELYGQAVSDGGGDESPFLEASADADALAPLMASAIATGTYHACAISDASVYCWGTNAGGALGVDAACDGGCGPQRVPFLDGLASPVALTAGFNFTCALLVDGTAYCWGLNNEGQLGLGSVTSPGEGTVPGTGFTSLATGEYHACALVNGGLLCWGSSSFGQLGRGDTTPYRAPEPVPAIMSGARDVRAGASFTCALLVDGGVDCWGLNSSLQVGSDAGGVCDDAGHVCVLTPTPVSGLEGVDGGAVQLCAGANHACATMADSTARCWGDNGFKEVGAGTNASTSLAVPVLASDPMAPDASNSPLTRVAAVYCGDVFTCAQLTVGGFMCWGTNTDGEMGPGAQGGPLAVPIPDLAQVAQLALGDRYSCGIFKDGHTACWGYNGESQAGPTCDATTRCPLTQIVFP
jgi:alpha-tubulin suppressor-like RCC1 family protein